jgi:hypothetical protein
MILADVVISTPWMLGALAGAGSVIAFLFRALIVSKDREYEHLIKEKERDNKELENLWKSFRDISNDAVKVTTARENAFRAKEGLPPMLIIPDVVPEAFSPSTELSRANAEIATLRAQLVQLKLSAGIPPTQTPEAGTDKR